MRPKVYPIYNKELSAGEQLLLFVNVASILAEEESEIVLNDNQVPYPMKPDEALIITGIPIWRIRVNSGKVKVIGARLPQTALPRMITQRSVTLYGVESAVLSAIQTFYGSDYANVYLPKLRLLDYTVPSGERWGLGGNMFLMANSFVVEGELVISDSSLLEIA